MTAGERAVKMVARMAVMKVVSMVAMMAAY